MKVQSAQRERLVQPELMEQRERLVQPEPLAQWERLVQPEPMEQREQPGPQVQPGLMEQRGRPAQLALLVLPDLPVSYQEKECSSLLQEILLR